MPPREMSQLPLPGNLELTLALGKALGRGATGDVFPCNVVSVSGEDKSIPPLVIKVSGWAHALEKEAWWYEEMECLQGSCVPRCYGIYSAAMPHGCRAPFQDDRFMQELDWEEREEEDHSARTVTVLLLERAGSLIWHNIITSEEDPIA